MRGSVEAVAAYAVLGVVLIGQRVQIGFCRHGLMECGIENAYHRSVGHKSLAGCDTLQVGGVVQRSQVDAFFQSLNDVVGDEDGARILLACVYYAVANCADLIHGLGYAVLGVGERVQHVADGVLVILHRSLQDPLVHTDLLVLDHGAFDADSLDQAFAQEFFVLHLQDLILQGRAAAVDD